MPIGAAVACKAGIHQLQTVQQLRSCTEGAANARNTGALMQGQRGGDIHHLVHAGLCRLGHTAAGVGREGFQVSAGALCMRTAFAAASQI